MGGSARILAFHFTPGDIYFGDADGNGVASANSALTSAAAESPIHLSHHDIDAAEDYHYVSHGVPEAQVLEKREINETGRAHPVPVRIRAAVADQIESELTLRAFDSTIRFTNRRTKRAREGTTVGRNSRGS